ncbi:MAG: VWA domain-containing protein [Gemmatimonadota bacterium]
MDAEAAAPGTDWLERAARALAACPSGLGGAILLAPWPHERDSWLDRLAALAGGSAPGRLPPGTEPERLTGGLDVLASVRRGQPVRVPGLLERHRGGLLVVPQAGRTPAELRAPLLQALEGEAVGIVALEDDPAERVHPALVDRVAFLLAVPARWRPEPLLDEGREAVARARERWSRVQVSPDQVRTLVERAARLGIASLRAPRLAVRTARVLAALAGRTETAAVDVEEAAALVFSGRTATALPDPPDAEGVPEPGEATPPPPDPAPQAGEDASPEAEGEAAPPGSDGADRQVETERLRIPPELIRPPEASGRARGSAAGREGAQGRGGERGRTVGTRSGEGGRRGRLHLIETLRAAAPWQPLRRSGTSTERLDVRAQDLRLRVIERPAATLTVFVVDASGSQARARLGEAKGAVELLLADSYRRREQVALVAFRGREATVELPPTRALARARRVLGGLPGGGGTPLAAGLRLGRLLAERALREGARPRLVLLTDGRPNVDLAGSGDPVRAAADALLEARRVGAAALPCLLVDTGVRPRDSVADLARALGARHVRLPRADAHTIRAAVAGVPS